VKNIVLTPNMTGIFSPDPLKFAFAVKSAAHAGRGGSRPLVLDDLTWQQWWSAPSAASERALYIHLPFCRKRCSFCNFFENGANPRRISEYVERLSQQLHSASKTEFAQSGEFTAVYVGGGTPTDMQAKEIAIIGEAIQMFPLAHNAEITLEGRLNGFSDAKFDSALSTGFNRFSFGVQSFNTRVRLAAGRFDNREVLIERLQQLSQHPSASIVADLIFGLPGQSHEVWQQDLQDVIESGVHGVDLYQLIALNGSRLVKRAEKNALNKQDIDANLDDVASDPLNEQADSQTRARMYAIGASTLEASGWQRLSSCHWRRDKRERSIYNSLAKSGIEILPFGAGAGGCIHGHAMMNARDLSNWHNAFDDRDKAANLCVEAVESTDIGAPLRVPAMVMSPNPSAALDSVFKAGLDRGELVLSDFESPLLAQLMPLFKAWQVNGLVEISDIRLTLTLAGRFWNVNLQTGLFSYLKENPFVAPDVQSA